jgi:hypothetical protein
MTADELLNDLGLTAGLQDLRFDTNGCARLMFDGKTAVNFENDEGAGCIHLYTPIAPLPPDKLDTLYRTLLEANLFGEKTLGATLAIDDLEHEIVLCRCVQVQDATGKSFAEILERFVSAAEDWIERINHVGGFENTDNETSTDPSMPPLGSFLRA